jgi:hypothetical protein
MFIDLLWCCCLQNQNTWSTFPDFQYHNCSRLCQIQVQTHGSHGLFLTCENKQQSAMWINFDIIQGILMEHANCTDKIHNHQLYILEQPSSCSTSWMHPSWPHCRLRLSLLLVFLTEHASCCHAQPSILLFISMGWVSHLMPSLLSGWLLTNVQVNNITTLYDTHGHIYITSAILFFSSSHTSSILLGRLADSDPSCLTQQ